MSDATNNVLELLSYIEQVEKLKTKPAFSVPTEFFVAHQHELKGLPQVQFNLQVEDDDVWMRIPRLQETLPPALPPALRDHVLLSRSVDVEPELKPVVPAEQGMDAPLEPPPEGPHPWEEEFDTYCANVWAPWAEIERARRATMTRYNQLFSLHQAMQTEGAETPLELVWGIGYATWKNPTFGIPVKYPLILQSCDIHLNPLTFELQIRPRDLDAKLDADCYAEMELPGVHQVDAYWKSAVVQSSNRINPFEESTYAPLVKAVVSYLDATGTYVSSPESLVPPAPTEQLLVTNTWVLFARKRSGDLFLEDIRRLKENVVTADSLPAVIRSFVEAGSSAVKVPREQLFRGLSSSSHGTGAKELYFPLPYNDEQVAIIQKLEDNDGVAVQGPPGTGKTYTIANVICHYLANGKRVLVTAKSESALAVLQEKLPEQIRPLSVSLLSDERDGMKQFEHAISTIAAGISAFNPSRSQGLIAESEQKLNQIHAKIDYVDSTVANYASKHMARYVVQGVERTPEELAKLVMEQAESHQWLTDAVPDAEIPFTEEDIGELRRARQQVGADINYVGKKLPVPDEFPEWSGLEGIHRDLLKSEQIDFKVGQGKLLSLKDSQQSTLDSAAELMKVLKSWKYVEQDLTKESWTISFQSKLSGMSRIDGVVHGLTQVITEVVEVEKLRKEFAIKMMEVPETLGTHADALVGLSRLCEGKSMFPLPFGKSDARQLLNAILIEGSVPANVEDWQLVQKYVQLQGQIRKCLVRWHGLAKEFPVPIPVNGTMQVPDFKTVLHQAGLIRLLILKVYDTLPKIWEQAANVFEDTVVTTIRQQGEAGLEELLASVQAHVSKGQFAHARERLTGMLAKCDRKQGPIGDQFIDFFRNQIGRDTYTEEQLEKTWVQMQDRLRELVSLQPALTAIERITTLIEEAGAPQWSARLRTMPSVTDNDKELPANWRHAWEWRIAYQLLDSIDAHQTLQTLFEERHNLTKALSTTYQNLVAEKTWMGVYHNSPDSVRQALQSYLVAVQKIGSGTGVRAVRHRKTAREAMSRAYQAVPCWVMPQWRVSETMPAELGLFDLVVVDEASQSDIWALPALLRGKQILVVGDHKQVSPSAVGMAEEKIKELMARYLSHQPHGAQMTPDQSIYDLARVVFAGNSIMLKEHFRCVPAIIEFSNREFYEGDIKPLRLPKANERLDPPLIDVYVRGGRRKGDTNPAEALAIVQEIEAIVKDPVMVNRTIGIVTLMGNTQAAHIQELISQRIDPHEIIARKIAVGAPPVFQGRERDIMMVSMVLGPTDRAAANKADMQQRFNVAISRARDRMYLFRSVTETTFKEDTLNARLIRHFRQPFVQEAQKIQDLRNQCESGFELDMFDTLVQRGFRVKPQVPCGGYRIDFVVEGAEGRRLAIECDGDRFHGPGQWSDDMSRQRVLERAGWTFWRCFASSYVRRREEVLANLWETLARLGIEPLGAESVDNSMWAHTREVDPYAITAHASQTSFIDEPL